jgi:N6-adenosine-specific RNA methylase IME4
MIWPFGDLRSFSYDLLMIDCPWHFQLYSERGERKSAQAQYKCMSLDAIKALPVGDLAAPDSALFMWATWPLLGAAMETMQAWGFRYVSGGVWHKRTKHGKSAFGTGYRLRSACEPWLLGTIGNPKTSRSHRNVIEGLAREHSRKPDEAYTWCESYMPNARRADVFSREHRAGWESCGNEANKFDEVA